MKGIMDSDPADRNKKKKKENQSIFCYLVIILKQFYSTSCTETKVMNPSVSVSAYFTMFLTAFKNDNGDTTTWFAG